MNRRNHPWIRSIADLRLKDIDSVGGKNASLGELFTALHREGIRVPGGFATTAQAYWELLDQNGLRETISREMSGLHKKRQSLSETGRKIRQAFLKAKMPQNIKEAIVEAYEDLCTAEKRKSLDVAVRSSATAEDLPEASFAGQQESFLNIRGEKNLLRACQNCFASLFTDRAISYREIKGYDHLKIALSIGVQRMVRSDRAASGVMFTLDPESGFPQVVVINATWGLGENIVKGLVTPDEFIVFKPLLQNPKVQPILEKRLGTKEKKLVYTTGGKAATQNLKTTLSERQRFSLSDAEVLQLARWGIAIEDHYGKPMDIEWAKDGISGEIFIIQARPETIHTQKKSGVFQLQHLQTKSTVLLTGQAVGESIASGKVCKIRSTKEIGKFKEGSILVTEMTDPDWGPLLKKAAGVITDRGGRTCHAAIICRELGVPAIVGTVSATRALKDHQEVTISCGEGDKGIVYAGRLPFVTESVAIDELPQTRTPIMLNLATPQSAFRHWRLPVQGIGLARMEFIIENLIKIHPMALVKFAQLKDRKARAEISRLTAGYRNKADYFVDHLACGIARIAASQYPHPVIVRTSDFKTNEYASLIGGAPFEPKEENPMLGFRGASRYYDPRYREGFALECRALRKVREEIGLRNVVVMIPFCRTLEEADRVFKVLAENGLRRGENGLEIYVMCEIPSNVLLADGFSERFDGFSIGSNDLTQLTLGVDRDSDDLAELFDEQNEAVKMLITSVIETAHRKGRKVGICGQAPSDYPDFAAFLVTAGIDSISLNPDSVLVVKKRLAQLEATGKQRLALG